MSLRTAAVSRHYFLTCPTASGITRTCASWLYYDTGQQLLYIYTTIILKVLTALPETTGCHGCGKLPNNQFELCSFAPNESWLQTASVIYTRPDIWPLIGHNARSHRGHEYCASSSYEFRILSPCQQISSRDTACSRAQLPSGEVAHQPIRAWLAACGVASDAASRGAWRGAWRGA